MSDYRESSVVENPLPEAGQYTNSIGYRRNQTDLKVLGITAIALLIGVVAFCWVTGTQWGGPYSSVKGARKPPMTAICKCKENRPWPGGCQFHWGDDEEEADGS